MTRRTSAANDLHLGVFWIGSTCLESTEAEFFARWRAVNAPDLVALVRADATFERGVLVERPDEKSEGDQHVA
jgi:hypothetical protein